MASIKLPELPKEKEFEEYISALFQSSGYFIERSMIDKEKGEEVLELDIVITDYDQKSSNSRLVEVKSGKYGFPDIFKVKGWMNYLNFEQGMFIVQNETDKFNFYKEKAKNLNIELISVANLTESNIEEIIGKKEVDPFDITVWRFSYWVERNLLKLLNDYANSQKEMLCYKCLKNYYFQLNSDVFFTESVIERVNKIYSTFSRFPRVSARCGNELEGKSFNDEHKIIPPTIFSDTYYKCNLNPIQISTFIEHKSRLALLKSAVDYTLFKENNERKSGIDVLGLARFPSFNRALRKISEDEYFHKYPVFWQWFIRLFGGFILLDYEDEEYELFSKKTGIPQDEIPNALEAYEVLFHQKDGWFMDLSRNGLNVKLMKLFPMPFRSMGAFYRCNVYTESNEYKDLNCGGLTISELVKWHHLGYEVLKRGYKE